MYTSREDFEVATARAAVAFTAVKFLGSARYVRAEAGTFQAAVTEARLLVEPNRPVLIYGICPKGHDVILATVNPKGELVPAKTKKGQTMTSYLLHDNLIARANDGSDDEFRLETLSAKTLVALHNKVAEKPVNKFQDNATAVARTAKVLADKVGIAPAAKSAKEKEKSKVSEVKKAGRAKYDRAAKIRVLVEANPIRPSAKKTHTMFELYLANDNLTVGEALEKGVGIADLAYHVKKGWVELAA